MPQGRYRESLKRDIMKNKARKNVMEFQPYIPGKPIEDVKREYNLKRVIKIASNENALGASPAAISGIRKVLKNINIYPDGNCFKLKEKISAIYGVGINQIIFGNGTDELIELVAKTFLEPGDEIVVSEHAFIRYKMAGDLMNCRVVSIPMKNYKHDLDAMASAVTGKTKIVFIANPNNPTGTYNVKKEFDDYFSQLSTLNYQPLTFIDEAYAEYVEESNFPLGIGLLKKGRNVMFSRTFSKIYGLAGLRVGYCVSDAETISSMERIRPPFNVSSVAQAGALCALEDSKFVDRSRKMVREQKGYLYAELKKLGFDYVPTAGNFILIDVKRKGREVFEKLLKKGIIVRPMAEYGFDDFIRVTIGTASENKKFITEVSRIS